MVLVKDGKTNKLMPLRDYKCQDCNNVKEYLIRELDDVPLKCEQCGSEKIAPEINTYGGYFGDLGSSSVRPKNAGSFKK